MRELLRAAFVIAMSGLQVALICPTTLLARQHYTNFSERFAGFPLKVGRLSRLVGAAETKATREARLESDPDTIMVVYRSEESLIWTRPRDVFFESVQHEGKTVPRFAPLD